MRSPRHVRTSKHGSAQHSSSQHGSAQHSSSQHGSAQHGSAQHGSAQHGSSEYGLSQPVGSASATPSRGLSVALACAQGAWPHHDWPAPDDPYVRRVLHLTPPYRGLQDSGADVVVLRCEDPSVSFAELLKAMGDMSAPVIVVTPRRDSEAVVEAFRGGAGYLVEGDYCTCMLSSAVMAATVGHTYLSPTACAALRDAAQGMPGNGQATEQLRALLSPRERQIMELLSTGLGAQEIGLRLTLSEKTVRNNLSNIYAKLDVRGSTEAVLRWLGATSAVRV
ncbi:response regulator transcription factor [Streptomyces ipomoeae]|uniref:response regulator transcription factor n=1 Tax=Streptomyces ipomoeae TaxID=103232 RepID=UPI0029AD6C88|nr:response regulator transcription factor [Streptomyces ipomoeae]MDX2697197.1 response regulator transcription factor [Streptomyces ipomoeae]MDX2843045.1 response regulator transcription factor [Streptomyces ipomoeae]